MNPIILAAVIALSIAATPAFARGGGHHSSGGGSHSVRAHVTKRGTYVAPTRATNPNKTKRDNYSHKGNVNPYNGKTGTKN